MKAFFRRLFAQQRESTKLDKPEDFSLVAPCCSEKVHIAYRGVSDDRLYLAYDRKWREVKYFRPNGLRIFCSVCRHQIQLEK